MFYSAHHNLQIVLFKFISIIFSHGKQYGEFRFISLFSPRQHQQKFQATEVRVYFNVAALNVCEIVVVISDFRVICCS